MKPDFGIWAKLSQEKIPGMIITGAKNIEDLRPSNEIIRLVGSPKEPRAVLDFGCGVGRNIAGMKEYAPDWHVVGYDNEIMVANARLDHDSKLTSDWQTVLDMAVVLNKFDTIFCCFVLQHIPEEQLRQYLDEFKVIGRELFVFGRRALDPSNITGYDGGDVFKSVWEIILDSGYEIIDTQDGFVKSGNGNDHHWARFRRKEERDKKTRDRERFGKQRKQVDF